MTRLSLKWAYAGFAALALTALVTFAQDQPAPTEPPPGEEQPAPTEPAPGEPAPGEEAPAPSEEAPPAEAPPAEEEPLPEDQKVENATISGEVVDLWGYLKDDMHGAEDKERAMASIQAGNPVGIVDARGAVFLILAEKENTPAHTLLADKVGTTVTVTGTRIRKGGESIIFVASVQ